MDAIIIHVINGIAFGMILFLIASGLSIIFGFMGVLNLAHGALYVSGALIGFVAHKYGFPFFLAAVAGGFVVAAIGFLMDRFFLGRLRNQMNEQVLLTLGFVYVFQNLLKWIFGPYPKIVPPPKMFSGAVAVGEMYIPSYRLFIIFLGLILAFVLWFFNNKTKIGSIVRAGMDDKNMAISLGVNYSLISTFVFVFGAFVGGFAGFVGLPIFAVHAGSVFNVLLLSLIVIVVGGVGRIEGVLLGAVIVGLIDSLGKVYFPNFAYFTMYLAMILILLFKPSGLLGRKLM